MAGEGVALAAGLAVTLGLGRTPPGVAEFTSAGLAVALAETLAETLAGTLGAVLVAAPGEALAVAPCSTGCPGALNSAGLAGTSPENDLKIAASSGCVHSTFAVSPGTTSPRG